MVFTLACVNVRYTLVWSCVLNALYEFLYTCALAMSGFDSGVYFGKYLAISLAATQVQRSSGCGAWFSDMSHAMLFTILPLEWIPSMCCWAGWNVLLAFVPSHHEQSIAYLPSFTACCHNGTFMKVQRTVWIVLTMLPLGSLRLISDMYGWKACMHSAKMLPS